MQNVRSINLCFICFFTLECGLTATTAKAIEADYIGQLSVWHIEARDESNRYYSAGLRYIPLLTIAQALNDANLFDLEVSFKGFASIQSGDDAEDSDLDLYRLKLRFATVQTETRLGLQKINFGPAFLLRSLMWFDRVDPRDPLKLTDGVYALRFKYDTLNNASLWMWGLYGNDDTKGFERFPTADEKPEFGGRFQFPVPVGEMAFTFHRRKVDASPAFVNTNASNPIEDFTENRFAADGRWDLEIGLWCESVFLQQRAHELFYEWTKFVTVGMDYTLGIGNGLHIIAEHQATVFSDRIFGGNDDIQLSAFSFNYFAGYLDNLSAIGFYLWEDDEFYPYVSWQRTWDNFILNLNIFNYPDREKNQNPYGRNVTATGYGGQILAIYNH